MPLSDEQIYKMQMKRKKVLDEAIRLFSEQGYNETTIAKVAKAAGISFGSVFTYFPTKEDLFHHAVIEPLGELSVELLDFNPSANNPLLELEAMINKHIRVFANINTYLRLVVQVIGQYKKFEGQFKELDHFHNQFREKIIELIKNAQQKGQLNTLDPFFVATSYTSLLIGLRANLADEPSIDYWENFVPVAFQLFGPK